MAKILLGVTGSIAAYKAAELARLFVRAGHEVKAVMTPSATKFVTPLTFMTLTKNPVGVDEFALPEEWKPGHISLAEWADLVVVAPASANTLAKLRYGLADNYLTSVLLATRALILAAPAMNTGMWENPATQENLKVLAARGVEIVEPDEGELACGTSGKGRMSEPEAVFAAAEKLLKGAQ